MVHRPWRIPPEPACCSQYYILATRFCPLCVFVPFHVNHVKSKRSVLLHFNLHSVKKKWSSGGGAGRLSRRASLLSLVLLYSLILSLYSGLKYHLYVGNQPSLSPRSPSPRGGGGAHPFSKRGVARTPWARPMSNSAHTQPPNPHTPSRTATPNQPTTRAAK